MRVAALPFFISLAACAIAPPPPDPLPRLDPAIEDLKRDADRRTAEAKQEGERIGKLIWPAAACTKLEALKLISSPEAADIVARAALGLCGREMLIFETAVRSSERFGSSSEQIIERERSRLVNMAITIIVRERNRREATPAAPEPPGRDNDKI